MKNVNDIISDNYEMLHRMVKVTPAHDSHDEEDIFSEILMRAIRKYRKESEYSEEEVIDYIKKAYTLENYYRKKRPPKVQIFYVDSPEHFAENGGKY